MILVLDPVTAPMQYGPYLACTLICVGLYLWSSLRDDKKDRRLDKFHASLQDHIEDDEKNLTDIKTLIASVVNSQRDFLEGQHDMQRDLVKSQTDLGSGIGRLADALSELSKVQSNVQTDQKILISQNQILVGNFQRIVDNLILQKS